jgi:hypothetical protein
MIAAFVYFVLAGAVYAFLKGIIGWASDPDSGMDDM